MAIKSEHLTSDYTIDTHSDLLDEYDGSLADTAKALPMRLKAIGPFNLRLQPTVGHYKTFLGEQKS